MKSDRVATYFYIVVNEKFPTTVTYKHESLDKAKREAERLARSNPGESFIVMEAICGYKVDNLVVTEYTAAHNNPNDPEYIPF